MYRRRHLYPAWLIVVAGLLFLGLLASPSVVTVQTGSNLFTPPSEGHWLGTDALGRDVFVRTLLALGRTSREVIPSAALALAVGMTLAVISARFFRRWPDRVIVALAEGLRSFPSILLVLLFSAAGASPVLLLGGLLWTPIWRVLRVELASEGEKAYAIQARLAGLRRISIVLRDVFPNVIQGLLPYVAALAGDLVAAIAALSFLGFGPPLEKGDIGTLLVEITSFGTTGWWIWLPSLVTIGVAVGLLHFLAISERGGARPREEGQH